MSDQVTSVDPGMEPQASLGLREARERAGLHLVALAAMLKVPAQRLEALEAGRFHELPDTTFARALALSVCRVLKIDAAPVLAALPGTKGNPLGDPIGSLNAPMPMSGRAPFGTATPSPGERRVPWAPALALLVLVAAATLWFLLPERMTASQEVVVQPVTQPALAGDAGPAGDPAAAGSGSPVTDASATAPTPSLVAPAAVAVAPAASAPAAASGVASGLAVADKAESGAAAPAGILQIRAVEATWLQVTGASGRVWLQRGLQSGEQVAFSADLPLSVVVGRADGAVVTVRGAAFDLGSVSRNNVARFEVK